MLISNLQKLTLATPGSCTGSPPTPQPSTTGWGPACGWGTWSAVSANGPDGGSVGKTSSSSWTTLTESLMCLEVSMSPWYVLWDIFYASCCSPSSCPTVMQPMTQYPRCGKREMGLFGRILQSEGIQTLIHMLSLSPTGEIKSPARISWHQTVLPWGKGNVGKVKHFLSPSLIHPVSLFLSPCLFSWTLGFVQKFHLWVIIEDSVLQGLPGHGWEGQESVPGALGSTAKTEVCVPITWCTGGWESSQVPWCMGWWQN